MLHRMMESMASKSASWLTCELIIYKKSANWLGWPASLWSYKKMRLLASYWSYKKSAIWPIVSLSYRKTCQLATVPGSWSYQCRHPAWCWDSDRLAACCTCTSGTWSTGPGSPPDKGALYSMYIMYSIITLVIIHVWLKHCKILPVVLQCKYEVTQVIMHFITSLDYKL